MLGRFMIRRIEKEQISTHLEKFCAASCMYDERRFLANNQPSPICVACLKMKDDLFSFSRILLRRRY